jgi:hypothetical protein
MAIAVYFHPKGMTMEQFEEAHRRLSEAGEANPAGRIHHSCFGEDGGLMVYDVWESPGRVRRVRGHAHADPRGGRDRPR